MTTDEAVSWALRIERNRRNWTADAIARPVEQQGLEYGIAVRTSSGRRVELWTLDEIDAFLYRT